MNKALIILSALLFLSSCNSDIPTVSLGIDEVYFIPRMTKLKLEPALTGKAYEWKVNGNKVSDSSSYIFLAKDEGAYDISFEIIDESTPYFFNFTINVMHEEVEYSPYISKVYEYCPAPGQFINDMPKYEEGDTYADIIQKVEESISGTNDVMISLGAFGGYVTFGFDHTVINVAGEYDFRIWGNAFYELLNPDEKGGSCEPGIVSVSYDVNCNGLPDDPWYELAGSDYFKPSTIHDYTITYHAPDPDRNIIGNGFLSDIEYIRWHDSSGDTGYVHKNSFHQQDYYPKWVNDSQLEFSGTRLAKNAIDQSGNGTYFVLYSSPWGYVDNHPNEFADLNSFDIDWAVDKNGMPVKLPGVDFVRVMTGINQYCGWLGETSTELSHAEDLHITVADFVPEDPITNN